MVLIRTVSTKDDNMSLEALAQFAVNNNNAKGTTRTPLYQLSIEDARAKVKIKDGNKIAKEDGSQALTLTIGKHTLSLDVIKPKATRVNAAADQVEEFTSALQAAVDAGEFDEAIIAAQAKADPANKPAEAPVETGDEGEEEEAPEGVDLDALDGEDELG